MQGIAVVGAGGKMGAWFANYFARRGKVVSVYDVNTSALKQLENVRVAKSIPDCVRTADLVFVCVPVRLTPKVVQQCAKSMKAGAVIAEIASVKHKAFAALKRVQGSVKPLCIHPMFGPGASEKKQLKILLVPVRNQDAEAKIVSEVFDNAAIKVIDVKAHDKSIALVLGLTYFTNVAFAKVMAESDLSLLKEVSGTTFGVQSLLAASVMTDEPGLIAALIKENPYAKQYIRQYLKEASRLSSAKDIDASLKKIKARLQKQQDLAASYRRMYDIVEGLK